MTPATAHQCIECGSDIAQGLLACPSCARLVHTGKLKELSATARQAETEGRLTDALTALREMLTYLPPSTRQHAAILQKVVNLSEQVDSGADRGSKSSSIGIPAFLLSGLMQTETLISFAVGLAIYWTVSSWQFALLFLLSIYVHEMGHVSALRRYGIPATAPRYIPGLGAFINLKQQPATPREDARTGLAGPIWGLGAAMAAAGVYFVTRSETWGAVAHAGAWVNLFNLFPIWQLDGGRGIRTLKQVHIWILAGLSLGMYFLINDKLLMFLAGLLAIRAVSVREEPAAQDWIGFGQFAGLIVALGLLCLIPAGIR